MELQHISRIHLKVAVHAVMVMPYDLGLFAGINDKTSIMPRYHLVWFTLPKWHVR